MDSAFVEGVSGIRCFPEQVFRQAAPNTPAFLVVEEVNSSSSWCDRDVA